MDRDEESSETTGRSTEQPLDMIRLAGIFTDQAKNWADLEPRDLVRTAAESLLRVLPVAVISVSIESAGSRWRESIGRDGEGVARDLEMDAALETIPAEIRFGFVRGRLLAGFPAGGAGKADWAALLPLLADQLGLLVDRAVIRGPSASATPESGRQPDELQKSLDDARARLEVMLTAGEVGTWDYDIVNDVVWGDRNLARIFGVESTLSIDGSPIAIYLQAIHREDIERVQMEIGESIRRSDSFYSEYRIVRPGDDIRWVIARGRIDRDEQGEALRLPGVVVDITAQRTAEMALRATLSRWKLALESAEMGAWNIDTSSNSLHSDERFRMIFHGSTEEISLDEAFAALHQEDLGRVQRSFNAAMNPVDPHPYSEEYRVIHPDGKVVWVMSKGGANFEGTGPGRKLTSLDGTVTDITKRKEREESLRELAARLSDADRRKDEFIATLAHELRNPLSPIRTGLEVMRMAGNNPAMIEKLRLMMETQTQHLIRLIDDLLDVSRITSGKIELRKARMEIGEVVRSAVDAMRPSIEEAGHSFSLRLPEVPVYLDADSARISQVISNLLTNAIRYTNHGGNIVLEVLPQGEEAVLKVIDSGIGIAPGMIERIFEMFAQSDKALERSQGGLGIGLTLVKRLVEMHGGSVEARSEGEGKGSQFIVRLPVLSSSYQPEAAPPDAGKDAGMLKILIADDNVPAAETLAMVLTIEGHDVRVVADGSECVREARKFLPDLILMDLGMPRMNGYEAAIHIRGESWGEKILLVALTGWGQESDRERTREAGFDRHLVKPVEPADLLRLIGEVAD